MMKKRYLFISMFAALALVLAACGNNEEAPAGNGERSDRDTLTVRVLGESGVLDPQGANITSAAMIHRHVFQTLVRRDNDMNLVGEIATDWRQIDELTWEFDLRDDVYFHNGTHMTAEDVAFSINRATEHASLTPVFGMIDTSLTQVMDTYTVRIGTYYPFAPFLNHLAHAGASIVSRDLLEGVPAGDAIGDLVVGTGPYRLVRNDASYTVVERWDDFHGDIPNIREITWRVMPDPSTAGAALETGEIDILTGPGAADLNRFKADSNINVLETPGLGLEYIFLNNNYGDLANVLVRQAIMYAIDVPAIVEASTEGSQMAATGFVNENVFGHDPNFQGWSQDVEHARALMQEAGFSGEPGAADVTFELFFNGGNLIRENFVVIMANQLQEIGINAIVQSMDFTPLLEASDRGEIPAAALGWGTVTGDADYALFPLFHSSAVSPSTNRSMFVNAEFDQLIEDARRSTNPDERLELYARAQEILREEAPLIPISNNIIWLPTRSNVRGVQVSDVQSHWYGDVYFVD